jgi:lipopolysaccharide exporter
VSLSTSEPEPQDNQSQTLTGVFLNAGILALGSAVAQALLLLASPLLTRLYSPAAFGLFSMIAGIMSAPGAAANFHFETLLMLPRSRRTAGVSLFLALALPAVLAVIVTLLALLAGGWLRRQGMTDLLWYGGPWLFAFSCQQALGQWSIRRGNITWSAVAQIGRAVAMVLSQIGLSFLGLGGQGLLLGQLIGQTLGAALLVPGAELRFETSRHGRARMRALFRRYRHFTLFGTPQTFVETLTSQLPPVLLGLLFGPAIAGEYWLAYRIVMVPAGMIQAALFNAFYRKLAEDQRLGHSHATAVLRLSLAIAALGAIPLFIILIFGPELFGAVFGSAWSHAGEDARWLALWGFTSVATIPWATAIQVLGLQRTYLIYSTVTGIIRLSAMGLGGLVGIWLAVPAYCVVSMLCLAALTLYMWSVLNRDPAASGLVQGNSR